MFACVVETDEVLLRLLLLSMTVYLCFFQMFYIIKYADNYLMDVVPANWKASSDTIFCPPIEVYNDYLSHSITPPPGSRPRKVTFIREATSLAEGSQVIIRLQREMYEKKTIRKSGRVPKRKQDKDFVTSFETGLTKDPHPADLSKYLHATPMHPPPPSLTLVYRLP